MVRRARSRPRRAALVALGVVGGVAFLWCAWLSWATSQDLAEVDDEAAVMRAALVRGDVAGAERALADLREVAESAESRTSGLTWRTFEIMPWLGDDAAGVAVVAGVLADLTREGLPPVMEAGGRLAGDAFQPIDGVFPVESIASLEEPARQSEAAFASADARLSEVDSTSFVGPVATQFDGLRAVVDEARGTLDATYRAARLIPRMMAQSRPRHYLLVLQNNAELRSGGGLPGALTLVRVDRGRVEIVDDADMADLANGETIGPALTEEEIQVFGAILGRTGVDATLTPDFPRSADLIRARWERVKGGRVDGVVALDPVAVSYLLRGTGPVQIPGYAAVDTTNVVWAVENQIYRVTEDRDAHSDYQQAVASAVFDAFAAGGGDSVAAIRGLAQAVTEDRVRMHSFDLDEQAEIAGTRIAGELSTVDDRPRLGVYVNDAGPTKMQYYLHYDAEVFSRSCEEDRQRIAGSVEFHSDTPDDVRQLPPAITGKGFPGVRVAPGSQLLVVYLMSPVGGGLEELKIDGQVIDDPVVQSFEGHAVVTVGVELDPQERQSIEFVMTAGPDQLGDVDLRVTPGAQPGSAGGVAPTSC